MAGGAAAGGPRLLGQRRNTAPSTMFRWCQSCWVSIADRPKNAPAAIAPVAEGSHSRAARYIRSTAGPGWIDGRQVVGGAGAEQSVTGVISRPGSGVRVWNPSGTPTGAAIWPVNQGFPRWVTWRAIHQKPHT